MKRVVTISTATLITFAVVGITISNFLPKHKRQQGPARIIAAEEAEVGQLVRLSVEADADDYMWIVVPASEDFEIYADGQKAVFSARKSGDYLFIAAYCKNNKVSLLRHILKVKGPPKPVVPPGPNSTILELVPYWAQKYNISKEVQAQLSDNFSRAASAAAAGQYSEVQELISATAQLNKTVGGEKLLDEITRFIVEKAQAGELETMEQHIVLWNRIAAALKPYEKMPRIAKKKAEKKAEKVAEKVAENE